MHISELTRTDRGKLKDVRDPRSAHTLSCTSWKKNRAGQKFPTGIGAGTKNKKTKNNGGTCLAALCDADTARSRAFSWHTQHNNNNNSSSSSGAAAAAAAAGAAAGAAMPHLACDGPELLVLPQRHTALDQSKPHLSHHSVHHTAICKLHAASAQGNRGHHGGTR